MGVPLTAIRSFTSFSYVCVCVCKGYDVSWEEDANTVVCLHTLCHSDVVDQVRLPQFINLIGFILPAKSSASPCLLVGLTFI